jgi:hypothetical protein
MGYTFLKLNCAASSPLIIAACGKQSTPLCIYGFYSLTVTKDAASGLRLGVKQPLSLAQC